ncbi:MAG: hypothetical protein ACYSVY_24425, partial [Planctomycetota bacterium]
MKTTRQFWMSAIVAALLATPAALHAQSPAGTAFSYQGQLKLGGVAVDDTADFEFTLWDDPNSTDPADLAAGPLSAGSVQVVEGLFTVVLDFGEGVFTGDARWLEIAVRSPAGSGDFTTLSPRQELTPTPYAIHAGTAGSVAGGITGSGTANYIPKFTGTSTLANSVIYESGGNIGIGTTNPGTSKLAVNGGNRAGEFKTDSASADCVLYAENTGSLNIPAVYGYS